MAASSSWRVGVVVSSGGGITGTDSGVGSVGVGAGGRVKECMCVGDCGTLKASRGVAVVKSNEGRREAKVENG